MPGLLVLILCALVCTPAATGYLKRALVGRPRTENSCWSCRFDLRALREGTAKCPECGTPIVSPGQRPPTAPGTRTWLLVCGLALLLPGTLATDMLLRIALPLRRAEQVRVLGAYASGAASERAMRRALAADFRELAAAADRTGVARMLGGDGLIVVGGETAATPQIARLLDDPSIPALRRRPFLQALMQEYQRVPLAVATHTDTILADLLSGVRHERSSRSSTDYVPAPGPPRAIDAEEAKIIVEALLAIQADPSRRWNHEWGVGIEGAWSRSLVTREQFERYIAHSFAPVIRLVPDVPPRAGDLVSVLVEPRWRAGDGMPVRIRASAVEEAWKDRFSGAIARGASEPQVSHSLQDNFRGLLALPDEPGPHTVLLEVSIEAGPDILDAAKRRGWFTDQNDAALWAKVPSIRASQRIKLTLDLQASDAALATFDDASLSLDDLDVVPEVAAAPLAGGRTRVAVQVWIRGHADVAFDAFLTQGGPEFPLGWSVKRRFGTRESLAYRADLPKLDVDQPVTLILRSAKGPLARPAAHPVFWKGTAEFPGLHIVRSTEAQLEER